MYKRILLIITLLIVAIAAYFIIRFLLTRKDDPNATFILPRLELSEYHINSFDKEKTDVTIKLLIDNPSPLGFAADSLDFTFSIGGVEVTSGSSDKKVRLRGSDSSIIELPVVVNNHDMLDILNKLNNLNIDSTDYAVKINLYTNLPFTKGKGIEIYYKKKLPVYIIPEFKITNTQIGKPAGGKLTLTIETEITNKNNFGFVFKNMQYTINVSKERIAEGDIAGTVNIEAHSVEKLNIPVEISLSQSLKSLDNYLFRKGTTPYSYNFIFEIVSEDKALKDSKVIINGDGFLSDFKEL